MLILLSRHFADINNKATDEIWYKRAVDYHKVNPKAFVYSIPFDVGERKTTVMAMLIAWAFCNRGKNPASRQFPNAVLVCSPTRIGYFNFGKKSMYF